MNLLTLLLALMAPNPPLVDRVEGGWIVAPLAVGEILVPLHACPGAREGHALPASCLLVEGVALQAEPYEFFGDEYAMDGDL